MPFYRFGVMILVGQYMYHFKKVRGEKYRGRDREGEGERERERGGKIDRERERDIS